MYWSFIAIYKVQSINQSLSTHKKKQHLQSCFLKQRCSALETMDFAIAN